MSDITGKSDVPCCIGASPFQNKAWARRLLSAPQGRGPPSLGKIGSKWLGRPLQSAIGNRLGQSTNTRSLLRAHDWLKPHISQDWGDPVIAMGLPDDAFNVPSLLLPDEAPGWRGFSVK